MKLAIQICAELEWEFTKANVGVAKNRLRTQPFGECFWHRIGKHEAVIYESGATKTKAAAACQYAIDTWHPDAVVNLGTCGGVAKGIRENTILLVTKTFQYDVSQRFGTPSPKFLRSLETKIDTSWIDLRQSGREIRIGTIASADQDLHHEYLEYLQRKKVLAADWESASIATVCRLNRTKCLILRGDQTWLERMGTVMDRQERAFQRNTRPIMEDLFRLLSVLYFD
jgi:adenosylhomocysteine nucleosidase